MAREWPNDWFGFYSIPVAAFLGASITIMLVYYLARTNRTIPTTTLILAGVAVSSFATALTSYLMLRSNEELRRALGWLLGGSILNGWDPVIAVLPYIAVGLGSLLISGHALNVLQYGEEQAQQLGLNVERKNATVSCAKASRCGIFWCHWVCGVDCAPFGTYFMGTRL